MLTEGKRHVGRTIDWAGGTGRMFYYDYHHADVRLFDTTEVELHYRATISRNPIRDCRLQKWLRNDGCNHVIFNEHVGFAVPDFTLGLILTLNHNLFHLLYEGVGLRQFIDLYYIVKSYQGETHVKKLIRHFKLDDFAASCSWLLWHCFEGENPSSLLLKVGSPLPLPNEETGRFLLNEILKSGNFGKYDKRLNKNRYSSRMTLMLSWIKHSFRLFHLYPEEVLWTPFGIIRISMWRRMRVLMGFQRWR